MRTTGRRLAAVVMALAISLSFSGCGGGGEDDDTPAGPPPAAHAGVDQTIEAGGTVTLDGSGSSHPTVPVNQPPTANAGPDQTVDAGSVVLLIGSGADPDGRVAGVRWSQMAGTAVSLSMPGQLLTSFVAPEVDAASTLRFRLTVTDGAGAADGDDASVTVQPVIPGQAPSLGTGRFDDPASLLQ